MASLDFVQVNLYDATLLVWVPTIGTSAHNVGKLVYPPELTPSWEMYGMKESKVSFDEAQTFARISDSGATFSIEKIHFHSDYARLITPGTIIQFNKAGDPDDGNMYTVISDVRSKTWKANKASVDCKRGGKPW